MQEAEEAARQAEEEARVQAELDAARLAEEEAARQAEDEVIQEPITESDELTEGIDTEFEKLVLEMEGARFSSERRELMEKQTKGIPGQFEDREDGKNSSRRPDIPWWAINSCID